MEKVEFTSVYDILPKELVDKICRDNEFAEAECHRNSTLAAVDLAEAGYECYFCSGCFMYQAAGFAHSFNRVVIDGKSYYIDFTVECVYKKAPNDWFQRWIEVEYDPYIMYDMCAHEEMWFCPFIGGISDKFDDYFIYEGTERISIDNWIDYENMKAAKFMAQYKED